MSRNGVHVLPGAVLVSDAHYCDKRPQLFPFLQAIAHGDIPATQLILMGDIFDLLFGPIALTLERNRNVIDLIDAISEKMEVIYLEGNHDFLLQNVFQNITPIPIAKQPLSAYCDARPLLLSHGDYGSDWKYRLYTALIRSRPVMHLLDAIDRISAHGIIRWLDGYLSRKEDCYEIADFESIVRRRYPEHELRGEKPFVIEGHFHQNRYYNYENFEYFNLGAFACNERYYVVKSIKDAIELQECSYR